MRIIKKIGGAINHLIKKGYWYNEILFPDCKKFWTYRTFNTEVINLGSTSALNAFYYNEGHRCANFALRRNPLCADLAILKNYHSYLKPNATVIISICPFTSLSGNYEYLEDRYYTLLLPTSMPVFYYRRQQEVKHMMQRPILYYPIVGLFKDIVALLKKKKNIVRTEEWMEQNAKDWMAGWMTEFSIDNFDAPLSLLNKDAIQSAVNTLNEILHFCKERQFNAVLVIPPIYHTLAEKFTPKARHILLESLISKVNDKSARFLNYMDDSEFNKDATLFQNSFIMNAKGAKRFTKRVLEDLCLL